MKAKKILSFILPALVVIGLDRFTKHLVRTNPSYQHGTLIPGVINFHYTLNPGMAMGMKSIYIPFFKIDIPITTPVVSIISIIATIGIITYVFYTMRSARIGYLILMGMIVGGAIGNVIDRLIMAKIGGYGGILDGHVVDFIHFMPTINGYQVFPYVFNIADASITTAIICLLIFNKQILPQRDTEKVSSKESSPAASAEMRPENIISDRQNDTFQ